MSCHIDPLLIAVKLEDPDRFERGDALRDAYIDILEQPRSRNGQIGWTQFKAHSARLSRNEFQHAITPHNLTKSCSASPPFATPCLKELPRPPRIVHRRQELLAIACRKDQQAARFDEPVELWFIEQPNTTPDVGHPMAVSP